jgi:hypothetical protein
MLPAHAAFGQDRRPAVTAETEPKRELPPAAVRALAEAEVRRQKAQAAEEEAAKSRPKELQGQKGPDPVRYGDWEKAGIVSDF